VQSTPFQDEQFGVQREFCMRRWPLHLRRLLDDESVLLFANPRLCEDLVQNGVR
jgi:hypothetical protein